ncbi:hypothetical protein BDW42DRAFT_191913 [Aspergillus taichungensis]|uniref:Ribonuclease P/MRP protein subunit POP5 n=1 Tax=Aspergillus taichungensis TaxID=482145 RepID=A0A2J5I2J5_9EURO|nr:hypothetical protein BDW42DRAFT_191913 [Aspergillus taichungensis]
MVRVKHRYLLVEILYPEPASWTATKPPSKAGSTAQTQAQLRIHSPTSDALTPSVLAKMLREEVDNMFGDWGVGRLGGVNAGGVSVKYLSPATSTAIVRCPRASFRLVWTALSYMSRVPEIGAPKGARGAVLSRPCVFRVVKVSGTMRRAEEEAIRRARRETLRLRGVDEQGVLGALVGELAGVDDVMGDDEDEDVGMESDD